MANECPDMLPGCAREFGEIKQHLQLQDEASRAARTEIQVALAVITRTLHGNGNTAGSLVSRLARHGAYLKLLGATLCVLTPPAIYGIVKLIQR